MRNGKELQSKHPLMILKLFCNTRTHTISTNTAISGYILIRDISHTNCCIQMNQFANENNEIRLIANDSTEHSALCMAADAVPSNDVISDCHFLAKQCSLIELRAATHVFRFSK